MDPVTLGAVLLAILSGAGEGLGAKLCDGVAIMVRRPFHRSSAARGDATGAIAPAGTAELAALQQAQGDQERAVALAKAMLARSAVDSGFRQALESWWDQAQPIRADLGNVSNTIRGGTQQGAVLQGRDFSNISFGTPPASSPS